MASSGPTASVTLNPGPCGRSRTPWEVTDTTYVENFKDFLDKGADLLGEIFRNATNWGPSDNPGHGSHNPGSNPGAPPIPAQERISGAERPPTVTEEEAQAARVARIAARNEGRELKSPYGY